MILVTLAGGSASSAFSAYSTLPVAASIKTQDFASMERAASAATISILLSTSVVSAMSSKTGSSGVSAATGTSPTSMAMARIAAIIFFTLSAPFCA